MGFPLFGLTGGAFIGPRMVKSGGNEYSLQGRYVTQKNVAEFQMQNNPLSPFFRSNSCVRVSVRFSYI